MSAPGERERYEPACKFPFFTICSKSKLSELDAKEPVLTTRRSKLNGKLDWDDFFTILQIAEAGSLAGAARATGQSRPTISRRLNSIEGRLGARIFERFRHGYEPTGAGQGLINAARQMRALAREAERGASDRDKQLSGSVVLTTTDTIFAGLLASEIVGFREQFPSIVLDVLVSNDLKDIDSREADVALRPTNAPPERLVGRKLGVIRQAAFATSSESRSYIPVVGPSEEINYPPLHQATRRIVGGECVLRANSILALHQLIRAGAGVGILPTYLGDADPLLTRQTEPFPELDTELWLLTDPHLRKTARISAVLRWLGNLPSLSTRLS